MEIQYLTLLFYFFLFKWNDYFLFDWLIVYVKQEKKTLLVHMLYYATFCPKKYWNINFTLSAFYMYYRTRWIYSITLPLCRILYSHLVYLLVGVSPSPGIKTGFVRFYCSQKDVPCRCIHIVGRFKYDYLFPWSMNSTYRAKHKG